MFIEPWESNDDEVIPADNNQSKIKKANKLLRPDEVGSEEVFTQALFRSSTAALFIHSPLEVHGKHNRQDDTERDIPQDFRSGSHGQDGPPGSDLASAVPHSPRLCKQTSRLKKSPARAVDDSQR